METSREEHCFFLGVLSVHLEKAFNLLSFRAAIPLSLANILLYFLLPPLECLTVLAARALSHARQLQFPPGR